MPPVVIFAPTLSGEFIVRLPTTLNPLYVTAFTTTEPTLSSPLLEIFNPATGVVCVAIIESVFAGLFKV